MSKPKPKLQTIDIVATLGSPNGDIIYKDLEDAPIKEPVEETPENSVVEPVASAEESIVEPEKVTEPAAQEPVAETVKTDEPAKVEEPVKADDSELDYLAPEVEVPKTSDETQKIAHLEQEIERLKSGLGVPKLDEDITYQSARKKLFENVHRFKLASEDPEWIDDNYASLVARFGQANQAHDFAEIKKIRGEITEATQIDGASAVSMLLNAVELTAELKDAVKTFESKKGDAVANYGFEKFSQEKQKTLDAVEGFRAKIKQGGSELLTFVNKADPGTLDRISQDVVLLLAGPSELSAEELSKMKKEGIDPAMKLSEIKKKDAERREKLIPSVLSGLYLLTQFKDLHEKATKQERELRAKEEVKEMGKVVKFEAPPKVEQEPESEMEKWKKRYGQA